MRNKITFIFLFLFILLASCKSPTSPNSVEPNEPPYSYTYGLYDNFESGSLDTFFWDYFALYQQSIKVIDDGTGNQVLALIEDHCEMINPSRIYPDEFDRLNAKVRLCLWDRFDFKESWAYLRYSARIPEQGYLDWISEIGIKFNPSENTHLYAQWKNYNTGEVFYNNLGSATFDKWYKLGMIITKLSSSELKVEYSVNDVVLAQSIPTDSAILIDQKRLGDCSRRLGAYSPSMIITSKAWFDDVWGVYRD